MTEPSARRKTDDTRPETMRTVPNQPKTPQRTIRMSDPLWQDVQDEATRTGESASEYIRRLVEEDLRRKRRARARAERDES